MYHQFVFVTRSVFSPSKSGPQTCFFSKVSPMGFVIGDTFLSLVYRWFMTPKSASLTYNLHISKFLLVNLHIYKFTYVDDVLSTKFCSKKNLWGVCPDTRPPLFFRLGWSTLCPNKLILLLKKNKKRKCKCRAGLFLK